jgi:hypothetical protein
MGTIMADNNTADTASLTKWLVLWVENNVRCATHPDDDKPDPQVANLLDRLLHDTNEDMDASKDNLLQVENVEGDLEMFLDKALRRDWANQLARAGD